jgi:uncharacterized protein YrrD
VKLKNQIVGLPVLSITEVTTLGKIENLLINPNSGSVDYLIIEPKQWYMERRLISFKDVVSIGQDALTTETGSNLTNVTSVPAAIDLLNKSVEVVGSKVITQKGRISGSIDEISIDEETGKIVACSWIPGNNKKKPGFFPASLVITFGKGMLVVEEDFEAAVVENIEETESENNKADAAEDMDEALPDNKDPLNLFEEKQKQYLIGRTVTANILSDDGETIAEQDQKITKEILDKAVEADKFVELTLNNRE